MVNPLEQIFPGLAKSDYQLTSPADRDYNCVAWAVGDVRNWWWPGPDPVREYWPVGVTREASRQLANGRWTSKLGKGPDIEHSLHDLSGEAYGSVVLVMKRHAT